MRYWCQWSLCKKAIDGTVGREFVKKLLEQDIELTVSTHQWGINTKGWNFGFNPDPVFFERLIQKKQINPEYLMQGKRDLKGRPNSIDSLIFSNKEAKGDELLIRQFDGKEDINLSLGGIEFCEKQPKNVHRITEITQNTTKSPIRWKKYNKQLEELWVPCEWAKQGVLNVFDEDKVKVMPYGMESVKPTFNDRIDALNKPYFVFGTCARWTNLKALDILVKAYIEEFTENDNVLLFIKTTINQQYQLDANMIHNIIQGWISEARIFDPPEIGFMSDAMNVQEYWDMLNAFDAFVLPTRGEAIGLVNTQAMSLGIPTISTDYSAMKDYLNKNNGFPIDIEDEVPVKQHCNQLYYYGGSEYGGKWAQPSQKNLQQQMRKVYEMHRDQPEKLQGIADKGKETVRKLYNWDDHIKTRMKRMEEIVSKS